MDIHIILNPGAAGTPPKAQQSKKPKPFPTSVQSSPGSAIHRRSSLRSSSTSEAPGRKSYATPIGRHPTPSPLRASPLLRQARPRKRVLCAEDAAPAPTHTKRARSNSNSTSRSTHSSRSSAGSGSLESAATTASLTRASLLLTRAKQHVAREASFALGRQTRSMMDIVMDLKGPAREYQEHRDSSNVFMLIGDRSSREDASCLRRGENNKCNYDYDYSYGYGYGYSYNYNHCVLTDDEGLAAYWAGQAAIWMDGEGFSVDDDPDNNDNKDNNYRSGVLLTRFPVSMERSTATWEWKKCKWGNRRSW
ncbi:hypothetical protein B0H19DRAFT_368608 [Mycena capillaripes]|nr:hypothetical protein B0H19DRAFT_368608 [Mycena capillaripes]